MKNLKYQALVYNILMFFLGLFLIIFKDANKVLSIIVGSLFLVTGAVYLINNIFTNKKLLSESGLLNVFILSFGIVGILGKLPIQEVIIYSILILGLFLSIDSFVLIINGNKNMTNIITLVFGLIMLILAILFLALPSVKEVFMIIMGITLMLISIINILFLFLYKKEENMI
jgi:hypothetical protein